MPRLNYVKKARKDNPAVKAGQPYWWWKFKMGPKHYSATRPPRSALTRSHFKATVWDLQDNMPDPTTLEEAIQEAETIVTSLEELRDEQQESLDAMPYSLQEGDTGQLLQERIESLEDAISILYGADGMESQDEVLDAIQEALDTIAT